MADSRHVGELVLSTHSGPSRCSKGSLRLAEAAVRAVVGGPGFATRPLRSPDVSRDRVVATYETPHLAIRHFTSGCRACVE